MRDACNTRTGNLLICSHYLGSPGSDTGSAAVAVREPDAALTRQTVLPPGGEHALGPALRIDLENRGAPVFLVDTLLSGVAVRANAHIQLRAVWGGDYVLGPVVIDRSCRQRGDALRLGTDARVVPSAYGTRTSASVFAM